MKLSKHLKETLDSNTIYKIYDFNLRTALIEHDLSNKAIKIYEAMLAGCDGSGMLQTTDDFLSEFAHIRKRDVSVARKELSEKGLLRTEIVGRRIPSRTTDGELIYTGTGSRYVLTCAVKLATGYVKDEATTDTPTDTPCAESCQTACRLGTDKNTSNTSNTSNTRNTNNTNNTSNTDNRNIESREQESTSTSSNDDINTFRSKLQSSLESYDIDIPDEYLDANGIIILREYDKKRLDAGVNHDILLKDIIDETVNDKITASLIDIIKRDQSLDIRKRSNIIKDIFARKLSKSDSTYLPRHHFKAFLDASMTFWKDSKAFAKELNMLIANAIPTETNELEF